MAFDTGPATAFESLVGSIGSLFGGTTKESGWSSGTAESITNATQKRTGLQTSQLQLEDEAVQQIIRDVLGGPDGLASIFAAEQNSGIYNSSVAAQAAGDIAAKLVGEIAKITGKQVDTLDETAEEEQITTQTQETQSGAKSGDKGVLGGIGDFFGF